MIHNEQKMKKTFSVWSFSQNRFLSYRKKFSAFYPKRVDRSGWPLFYEQFGHIGVRVFFLRNVVPIKFGSLQKIHTIGKKKVFGSVLNIFLLLTFLDGIFQNKIRTPIGFQLPQKFSARYNKVSIFAGRGENFWWFLTLGTSKTPRRTSLGILSL